MYNQVLFKCFNALDLASLPYSKQMINFSSWVGAVLKPKRTLGSKAVVATTSSSSREGCSWVVWWLRAQIEPRLRRQATSWTKQRTLARTSSTARAETSRHATALEVFWVRPSSRMKKARAQKQWKGKRRPIWRLGSAVTKESDEWNVDS